MYLVVAKEIKIKLWAAGLQYEPRLLPRTMSGSKYKLPPYTSILLFCAAQIPIQLMHTETLCFIIRSTTQTIVFLFNGCRLRMQGFELLWQTLIKGN